MKKLLLIGLALFTLNACSKEDCNPKIIQDCACTAIYDPVCGCNGMTYGNACEAECNSITDYKKGECE